MSIFSDPNHPPNPSLTSGQTQPSGNPTAATGTGSSSAVTGEGGHYQMNLLSFCKVGAETVQDIVSRTIELFSLLKSLQVCDVYNIFIYISQKTYDKLLVDWLSN